MTNTADATEGTNVNGSAAPHGSLDGKTALVTGGSRGIGAAVALRLARAGADVAVTYVNGKDGAEEVVRAVRALGRRAVALRADAADAAEAAGAVERTVEELGGLDVLVNNAGVGILAPLEDLALADVDRVLAVNVRGVFLASQAAAARMTSGARIITIGTCMTQHVPGPGGTLYTTSKAALVGLTRALARELGERGITANIVHPGPTDTDMNPADGPQAPGQAALTALGRYGTADEVAATVTYLAGPDAAYVSGAELVVDGGYAA
ncbi:NAD(P)-dependent dehydrogenase (short-subunit alcohol dehydrogenase family) [Streptomyces griseochromogenes]|uniref:NAD(P)-dependent dehydrogenase (Short-subunit alcohol dehydrogenase family) n=1 Tax=Streptomyces griseochromogenes TaxID=68214 RepID=A0ABS4LKD5_9ACTN|nr:SDR family oxidoreductase [Streptomyces griseochromogenes]MBP2047859.1 NAD(P)-dependent dehydrogenase (short-subunit alcohol dehydrogenase family) [Streptomyces griseochromogenes]